MADSKNYLISDEEMLLTFNTTRFGDVYVSDSTSLGKTYTLDMLLDEPGDHCPRVLVLNTKTLKSSDVTELFAAAWLKRANEADELDLDAETTVEDLEAGFPDYVKNSRAWAVWKDDLEAMQPVGHDPDLVRVQRRERTSHSEMFLPRPGLGALLEAGR